MNAIRLLMLWGVVSVCSAAAVRPTETMAQLPPAAEPPASQPDKVEPVLAPDRELLGKIKALPDNSWLKLPPVKTAGELNWSGSGNHKLWGPIVRSYCYSMVWAPDRKRMLYMGGGHNVHPHNDVWEYDLAANTWVCLYAPDPLPPRFKAGDEEKGIAWFKQNTVFRDGVICTRRGAPIRPCHTWDAYCYDPVRKRMLFMEIHRGLWFGNHDLLAKALGIDPNARMLKGDGSGPGEAWVFSFYPESRQWKEVVTGAPKAYEASNLECWPDGRSVWMHSGKTWTVEDEKANKWKLLAQGGPGKASMAYDPQAKVIVAVPAKVRGTIYVYSFADNKWAKLPETRTPAASTISASAGIFYHDPVAKCFVLYDYPELWVYDLRENKWTKVKAQGDVPDKSGIYGAGVAGGYDPERNVMVFYGTKATWVYRCKKQGR